MKTTVHNGKYRLTEKLGSGATSIVYKGERVADGKIVAIKVLRQEFVSEEESVRRFLREAEALVTLNHPNIVNIYDYGNEDETFYIVMEYVEGETLKRMIKKEGKLGPKAAALLALQICSALLEAHGKNVIHRDIKPQNILITPDGVAKVADFGIARMATQSTITAMGKDVLGSVHYISPEQARGAHLDLRSDIYSLGITLYEMVTGELPFDGEDPVTIAMKQVAEQAPTAIERMPMVPTALSNIIEKCMAKYPEQRYCDARELGDDLVRSMEDPEGDFVQIPEFEETDDAPTMRLQYTSKDEPEPVDEKVTKKKILQLALFSALAVVLLVGVIALVVNIVNQYSNAATDTKVSVPGVVNMVLADAQSALKDKDLTSIVEYEYSSVVDNGLVISQTPKEGVSTATGTQVTLVVSKGAPASGMVVIPSFVNLSLEAATAEITKLHLTRGTVTYIESDLKPGTVCAQDPTPKNTVAQSSKVNLTVSEGRKVPDLSGLNQTDAAKKLLDSGFSLGSVSYAEGVGTPGTVTQQSPAAGTVLDMSVVSTSRIINITISKYKAQIEYTADITSASTLEIKYDDNVQGEVTVLTQVLKPDGIIPTFYTVYSIAPLKRTYYIYLNGNQVASSEVDFSLSAKTQATETPE